MVLPRLQPISQLQRIQRNQPTTSQQDSSDVQNRLNEVENKLNQGQISSIEQINPELRQYFNIPTGYFDQVKAYQQELSKYNQDVQQQNDYNYGYKLGIRGKYAGRMNETQRQGYLDAVNKIEALNILSAKPKIKTEVTAKDFVGPTRGTYDVATKTYTLGNVKQSVANAPAGAKVFSSAGYKSYINPITKEKILVPETPFQKAVESQQALKKEEVRIDNLKKNILSSGGTNVTTTKNNILKEVISVDKIVNGKKVESKVITETDLGTGEKNIKTYEIKNKGSAELSGGLSYSIPEKKIPSKIPSMIGVYKEPTLLERVKIIFYKASPYFRDYVNNISKGIDRFDAEILKIGEKYKVKKEFVEKRIDIEKSILTNQIINLNNSMNRELSNVTSKQERTQIEKKYAVKIANLEKNHRGKMALLQRDLVNNVFISDVAVRLASSGTGSLKFGKEVLTNKEYREFIATSIDSFAKDKKFRDEAIKTIQTSIGDSWNRYVALWRVSPTSAIISTGGILIEGYMIGKAFQPVKVLKLIGQPLRNFPKVMKILGIVGKNVRAVKDAGKNIIKLGIKTGLTSVGKGTLGEGVTTGIALAGKKIASKYKKNNN